MTGNRFRTKSYSLSGFLALLIACSASYPIKAQEPGESQSELKREESLESIYRRNLSEGWSVARDSHEFRNFPQEEVVEFVEQKLRSISADDHQGQYYCYHALVATRAAEIPSGRKLLIQSLDDPMWGGLVADAFFYTPAEAVDEVRSVLLEVAQKPEVTPQHAQKMINMLSVGESELDTEMIQVLTSLFTDPGRPSRVRLAAAKNVFSTLEVTPSIAMLKDADPDGRVTGLSALLSTRNSSFYEGRIEFEIERRRQVIPLLIESLDWDAPINRQQMVSRLWFYLLDYTKTDDPEQLGFNRAVYDALQGLDLEGFDDAFLVSMAAMLESLAPHLTPTGPTRGFRSKTLEEADEEESINSTEVTGDLSSIPPKLDEEANEATATGETAQSEDSWGSRRPRGIVLLSIGALIFLLTFAGYRKFSKRAD